MLKIFKLHLHEAEYEGQDEDEFYLTFEDAYNAYGNMMALSDEEPIMDIETARNVFYTPRPFVHTPRGYVRLNEHGEISLVTVRGSIENCIYNVDDEIFEHDYEYEEGDNEICTGSIEKCATCELAKHGCGNVKEE